MLKKMTSILLILTLLGIPEAMASKIQQQGIVTATDCASRSIANGVCLPLTDQIYDSLNGQQLSTSISSGALGGSGGGGVQLLSNPGFEIGSSFPISGWTVTTGTGTVDTTNFYAGKQAATITASSQTSSIAQDITLTQTYTSVNMEASCKVKTSLTNVQVCARAAGSDLSSCSAVPSTNTWQYVAMNFIGPSSGTIGVDVKMTSSGTGSFNVDDCYVGPARNLSQVSQAQLYGQVKITGCAANWVTASTSFANYATQSGCTYAATGQAQAPATNVPGIKFASMAPGTYLFTFSGFRAASYSSGANINAYYRFNDGTNSSLETNLIGTVQSSSPTIGDSGFSGTITYTSAQSNVQINIQGMTDTALSNNLIYGTSGVPGVISVWYYPSQSQIAYNPSLSPVSWSGNFSSSTTFSQSAGNAGFADFTSSSSVSLSNRATPVNLTCTSHGSNIAGIDCPLPSAGNYKVCAQWVYANSGGQNTAFQLVDGSNNALNSAHAQGSANSGGNNGSLCGVYTATSAGTATFKLRADAPSGTITIATLRDNNTPLEFQVSGDTQNFPAPVLVGSVTSQSAGSERIDRASFGASGGSKTSPTACTSSPCTVYTQSGSWITSVTRASAGQYTVNIAAGEFSDVPSCTLQQLNSSGSFDTCGANGSSLSSTSFVIQCKDFTQTFTDSAVAIICQGPH